MKRKSHEPCAWDFRPGTNDRLDCLHGHEQPIVLLGDRRPVVLLDLLKRELLYGDAYKEALWLERQRREELPWEEPDAA